MEYLAHLRPAEDGSLQEHMLEEHLHEVARLAATAAQHFGAADWAALAGLWHDLGKYRPGFQRYLRSHHHPDAHLEVVNSTPHSTAGAIHAMDQLKGFGPLLAYLIAGHHAGLPDWEGGGAALRSRLERRAELDDALAAAIPDAILAPTAPTSRPVCSNPDGMHLWLRLLFSCLVDADFLDTEAFMDPGRAAYRGGYLDLETLLPVFEAHMQRCFGTPDTPVRAARHRILQACIAKAAEPPGCFSLTVPTGGGKTLSSLAFALHHAHRHGKRRVIYAIPYTSIIEQTADVLRGVFGERVVVEHHSNLDSEKETPRARLAAENWDAPIVVTTNVQLFESLYAARPGRCRKLHNLVDSVIILDEAQLLPPEFLDPIRQVLRQLLDHYGVTVVLSTATQPALGLSAHEIAPEPARLYRELQRVTVEWPRDRTPRTWEDLATELLDHDRVLVVVGRRDDARTLAKLLPEDTCHLSALMCGQHRSELIADIKAALGQDRPLRVVSTQLVEAGVDLDFPLVYRAFAGLDSIAQAAGRCNREGRLPGLGRVVVFNPPKPAPAGLLRKAEQAARELLAAGPPELTDPAMFGRYFESFYAQVNDHDAEGILPLLCQDARQQAFQFRTAASRFRLVQESGYRPVLVWHDERARQLIEAVKAQGLSRGLGRRLQRYTVSLPEHQLRSLLAAGDVEELLLPDLYAQRVPGLYDRRFGLLAEGP